MFKFVVLGLLLVIAFIGYACCVVGGDSDKDRYGFDDDYKWSDEE